MPNELPAQLDAQILERELAAHAPTCARRTDECLARSCGVRFVGPNGEDGVEGPYRPCSAGPAPRQLPRDGWRNLPTKDPITCTGRTSYAPPGPQPLPSKESTRAARIAADFENADPNGSQADAAAKTNRAKLVAHFLLRAAGRPA